MRKGKSIKLAVVVAVLAMLVGFAAVSTVLRFNGTVSLKGNAAEFENNLRFVSTGAKAPTIESSMNKTGNKSVSVSDNGKQLTFVTPEFNTVGETATVTYYVENVGQYDALLGEITCKATATNANLVDYLEIIESTNYNGTTLAAGSEASPTQTEEASTITVKLKKTYASEETGTVTITCQLPATAKEN